MSVSSEWEYENYEGVRRFAWCCQNQKRNSCHSSMRKLNQVAVGLLPLIAIAIGLAQTAWHRRHSADPNKSAFLPRIPAIASDHDMVVQCIVLRGPMTDFAAVSVHLKLAAAAAAAALLVHFRPHNHTKLSDQIFLARTKCACVALQTECHGRMQRTLGGLGDVSVLDGHGYSRVVATSK